MALSDYFSIWLIGVFLPGALIVALLADLLLVPALASVGVFRFRPPSAEAQSRSPQMPSQ
jgi:thiol:disulfide interchange protein